MNGIVYVLVAWVTASGQAMNLQISTAEVQAVLDMAVPKEYAEQSADLDADYYGRA